MIRQVRQITNDLDGRVAGDRAIIRFFNKAQDVIRGVKSDWKWLKVTDSSITTVANKKEYPLPSAIGNTGNVDDVRFRYADGTDDIIYALKFIPEKEFDLYDRDQNRTPDDYAAYYTLKEPDDNSVPGYIRIEPIPQTTGRGTFYIRHFKELPDLDSVDDETLVPIPSILEDFAIAQMERIKGNETKAALYESLFYGRRSEKNRIVPLDSGINLLIRLDQAQQRPTGQPHSLFRFRGQKALDRLWNNRFVNVDKLREDYW
jgi:hypothetical protein